VPVEDREIEGLHFMCGERRELGEAMLDFGGENTECAGSVEGVRAVVNGYCVPARADIHCFCIPTT